ncbi:MAG: DUF362 domain-containing protein [Clostridiales bacterium]|nr:DUF362 domain-containing protein [Clostridiales bacterium]
MDRNEILKIYGTDYREMTLELLKRAALCEMLPEDKESRIGIKPNLVSASEASCGATTHPEIIAGIIEYLQQHGYRNLVIAESSWVGARTSEAVQVCGYDRLVQKYGVEFLDAQKDRSFEKDCAGMKLNLCECVKGFDYLINVPVLKGHCQTKITCALKNMKGLIPNKEKRRFHSMGLHKPIAHLNAGIHQDFIVVDHICGDLDFEDGGNPVVRNCIMAAADPVLVDAYVCQLLHYTVDEVPYVRMAEALGIGCADLSKARITTCGTRPEMEELPREHKIVELQDAVSEVDSCSACYGYLIPALEMLRQDGLLDKLDEKICIGQGYQGKTGRLGVGRCTAGFTYSAKGCPPTENQIYEFLKEYLCSQHLVESEISPAKSGKKS